MTAALAKVPTVTEIAPTYQPAPLAFSEAQEQLIRDTFANGASQSEFLVLMEVAKARRLNPFLRQIHFVKRWNGQLKRDTWASQASIDGLRAIAERTGKYDGQDEPEFTMDESGKIVSCKVKIYRKDWGRPAVGVAYWSEYVQTTREGGPTRFWQTMPRVMLSKCAEAIALRKAFPEDMSGLYTAEEMQQADNDRPALETSAELHHSPHVGLGQTLDDPPGPGGVEVFDVLKGTLAELEGRIAMAEDWDTLCQLRATLGGRGAPSPLTREMQKHGPVLNTLAPRQHKELSKTWHRCNRNLTQREAELAPSVEASFVDDAEPS